MDNAANISLDRGWLVMLSDVGIDPGDVLGHAGLPLGLLHRETTRVTVAEYFAMAEAAEHLADDPLLPLRIGQAASPEAFSAPVFAALCSSTLQVAVGRLATHKRLMAPMHIAHHETHKGLVVSWAWDDPTVQAPRLLMALELAFLTQLARTATRRPIRPTKVTCPVDLQPAAAFADFFGTVPVTSSELSLTFAAEDAHSPFLTASETLWASFEPELQRRTTKLDTERSMTERTESMLLECLPSGEATVGQTARRLGVSSRTLQRRLTEEGVTFRAIVQRTRERLAKHYLENTALPHSEIAFLLGYDEPSSFSRAFHEWSGQTPESARRDVDPQGSGTSS